MPDLIVVGAGAAGLFTALEAAAGGARVALISAARLAETASYWAQGGLAAALAITDDPERHLSDTIAAGRGIVRESAAAVLCAEAPARFADLVRYGVLFDAGADGEPALGLEGGHSERRIVHADGSATGRRILRTLSARVVSDPAIAVHELRRVVGLLVADGAVTGVRLDSGRELFGRAVILASGGGAALWSRTTNPPGSWGSGLLLARDAGAELADLEFAQFHPTAVTGVPGREGFLISEAVRGEGATLHGPDGERFVDELAPRDEVSRAIFRLLRDSGGDHVELDMRAVDPELFPNIVSALRSSGLDPATARVPVSPASHYLMGGVACDLDARTSVPGLYAVGEVACTGLHGANRLASNSLSECFVFGHRAVAAALEADPSPAHGEVAGEPPAAPERATREAVWRLAGLEREAAGLEELSGDPHPLARLIAASALARTETRGGHARREFDTHDPTLDRIHSVVPADRIVPRREEWL